MDRFIFQSIVREMEEKNPRLFALESDNRANTETIEVIEKHYDVLFPNSYKDFVSQYGGGYFGLIVVYSCDCNGMFYIKSNALKEWVLEKSFLPVIDFETEDGICQNMVSLYSHEEEEVCELQMDFYDALLKYGLEYNK